jgi:RNA methyltransferase, TrmH family
MRTEGRELVQRYREARHDATLAVLEGFHTLKHALRFGAEILDVRTRDPAALARLAASLAPDVEARLMGLAELIDDAAFADLSPAPHPTGVMALARRPEVDVTGALAAPGPEPVVLLERPAHHGNIGAVVRVAAAAGAAAVLATGSHHPWHPASLRGGAGLQYALPVARVDDLPASNRPVVAVDPEGEGDWDAVPARSVLVFGSERAGISEALARRADLRLAIPMRAGVSSLNLATAVAVMLYRGQPNRPAPRTSPTA